MEKTKNKKRRYISFKCKSCGVDYKKRSDSSNFDYCNKCGWKQMRNGKYVNCHQCGKKHYRPKSYLNRGEKMFCSHKCNALWSGEHQIRTNFISKIDNSGKNNGRYKHGNRIGGHDRHKKLKVEIEKRDGEGCLFCERDDKIHVHRITPAACGGTYHLENVVMLCKDHHELVHSDYDKWKKKIEKAVANAN